MPQSDVTTAGSPVVASPRSPPQMYQNVHDVFIRLETRVGHVYNHREEYIEQDGREYGLLTKVLFHSAPPRAYPVVEPHICSHDNVELTNDRDNILWHGKTGEYCLEEDSFNRVVRFGKADKVYKERNLFSPRQLL